MSTHDRCRTQALSPSTYHCVTPRHLQLDATVRCACVLLLDTLRASTAGEPLSASFSVYMLC
jgi:hypothetical protein